MNNEEQSSGRSFARFAIIATLLALAFLFVKKDNVVRWIQAGFTIRKQERQIEKLKEENANLDEKTGILSSDRDSLERYARENYYFAAEGDDIYIEEP